MDTQYLRFVRKQFIVVTVDLSGTTKGQLVAFTENAVFEATSRSRSRLETASPTNGRPVSPISPSIPRQQSRTRGSSIALMQPVEYSAASWRRVVLSPDEH